MYGKLTKTLGIILAAIVIFAMVAGLIIPYLV